jgi:hypothetical protein
MPGDGRVIFFRHARAAADGVTLDPAAAKFRENFGAEESAGSGDQDAFLREIGSFGIAD